MPRALVVYPQKGYGNDYFIISLKSICLLFTEPTLFILRKLYASDWSSSDFIACLNMDGTKWQKIITAGIIWPNALTIDIFSERIFWADAFLDTIQFVYQFYIQEVDSFILKKNKQGSSQVFISLIK